MLNEGHYSKGYKHGFWKETNLSDFTLEGEYFYGNKLGMWKKTSGMNRSFGVTKYNQESFADTARFIDLVYRPAHTGTQVSDFSYKTNSTIRKFTPCDGDFGRFYRSLFHSARFYLSIKKSDESIPTAVDFDLFEGIEDYFFSLHNQIVYSPEAKEKAVKGDVELRFTVNLMGVIENVRVIRGIGYGCDENALWIMKNLPVIRPVLINGIPEEHEFALEIKMQAVEEK